MDQEPDPERLHRIEAALLELPKMDRQIFLAYRLDKMSIEEIARQTRLSRGQVERRLHRAVRQMMRRLLADGIE